MGINVGDKYIIEIGAIAELPDGKKKYFIKPFESLVFDRKGLEQLEKFDNVADTLYQTGFKEGYAKAQARPDLKRLKDDSYNKGYEDGAKNQDEVQYRKGFEDGNKIADKDLKEIQDSTYDVAYNKALGDVSELMAYITQDFINNCYPNDKGYNLYDLNAKYGLAKVLKDYKAYEEKKKAEKEFIKVGDEVVTDNGKKAIVTLIDYESVTAVFEDGSSRAGYYKSFKKTGRHFEEIPQLLKKLRGENGDNN